MYVGFHATVGMLVPRRRSGASDRTWCRPLTFPLREHGDEGHHSEPPGTSRSVGFAAQLSPMCRMSPLTVEAQGLEECSKIHCSDLCGALTESKRERRKLFGLLHRRNEARRSLRCTEARRSLKSAGKAGNEALHLSPRPGTR